MSAFGLPGDRSIGLERAIYRFEDSLRGREVGRYNGPALKQNQKASSITSSSLESRRKKFDGILLPIPTPFDSEGALDMAALRSNVQNWNKSGIAGIVLLGSTGERSHLEETESLHVIETVRTSIPDGALFIIGAGRQSTRSTVEEVRGIGLAGADALLVITPHFYRAEMSQDVLITHYLTVAEASRVPVLLYSVPQLTGVTLAPDTIARLSEHPNIVGVKDSSGDVLALAETVRLVPKDFAVLTGNGSALYPALCIGARGGILAIACIAPHLAIEICRAFHDRNHELARDLQQSLTVLTRGILGRYGISGLKTALDMLGYTGGRVRAPLRDACEKSRREIAVVLKETGLLLGEANGEGHRLAGAVR